MASRTKTGHVIENVSEEDFKRIHVNFPTYDGIVRLQPGNWFCLSTAPDVLDKLYDFNFRPTDSIVVTYPKSGTTWMQEIVWTLRFNPDLNNPDSKMSIDMRSPHLEIDSVLNLKAAVKLDSDSAIVKYILKNAPHILQEEYKLLAYCDWLPGERVVKSHLPMDLLPPRMLETSKVIYLARDPRDIIVSKYHFFQVLKVHNFKGTLDEFVNLMLNEEQMHHPFWQHLKCGYDLRDHPNMLFLYFEDLKANPLKVITQISEFLGLQRTPEQIKNVVQYTDFKNMKKLAEDGKIDTPMSDGGKQYNDVEERKVGGGFFRKGTSGTWKDSFTVDQVNKINDWMKKNLEMFPADFKYKTN